MYLGAVEFLPGCPALRAGGMHSSAMRLGGQRLAQSVPTACSLARYVRQGKVAEVPVRRAACQKQRQPPRRHHRSAGVQASSSERSQGPAPDDLPPALLLAGFFLEELATVRQLLDQAGGVEIRVVPTSPALLHMPLVEALHVPEPAWDQPVPPDMEQGGGWGQQRMILTYGINKEGQEVLLELLEDAEMPPVCLATATADNIGDRLGDVLAAALKQWRRTGSGSGISSSSEAAGSAAASESASAASTVPGSQAPEAPASAAAAAAATATAVPFVEKLPPVQEVVPAEVWQPGSDSGSGGNRRQSAGSRGSAEAAEVVQAEFVESSRQPATAAAPAEGEDEGEGLPLDVIDAIASGQEVGTAPAGQPAQLSSQQQGQQQGQQVEGVVEEDSEALLAAARAAMGLDSASLQQLVDEAAAKAAQAMNVPFMGADASSFLGAENPSGQGQAAAAAAAAAATAPRPPSSGSKKPWEVGAAGAGGGAAAAAAGSTAGKGFAPAPPSRQQAKAKAKAGARKAARAADSAKQQATAGAAAASQAAAQATPAPSAAGPASETPPVTGTGASSGNGANSAATGQASKGQGGEGGSSTSSGATTLPDVEQFVLSRSQLKAVTEKHGLDFEQLLAGLAERGIPLAD